MLTFLLLAAGVEILIDYHWPAMRDRWRCLILVVAAIMVGTVGFCFVE